ncbi:golvesin C-terminal-like domain-containing protein [Streptomyces sp. NPDC055103]
MAPVTVTVATALALPLTLPAQAAEPAPPKNAAQWQAPDTENVHHPSSVPGQDRAAVLGATHTKSTDAAFTTSGDGTGFHLLVADESAGYAWKTAASLSEPGFDTDTWIGNACLTASGKRAAVAYAPRTFTNKPELMVRGAFTAIVDLTTGKVTKLPFQASLAYFSPGCGTGEQAVFTQLSYEADRAQQTRLITVDTAKGHVGKPVAYPGQVTSAVPTKNGVMAAQGNRLVNAGPRGKLTEITRTRSVPFQLTVDAEGGLTYIDRDPATDAKVADSATTSQAQYLGAEQLRRSGAKPITVASGPLTAWDLTSSADGTVYVTGKATTAKGALPKTVSNPGGLAKGALLSSHGRAAVTTAWADGKDTRIRPEEALTERTVRTTLRLLGTGRSVVLDALPGKDHVGGRKAAEQGRAISPVLPRPRQTTAGDASTGRSSTQGTLTARTAGELLSGSPTDPSEGESERTCAVPRNSVQKQAFQPTPRQVEWAVDQAVIGRLNLSRGANWKNTGTGGYQPQGLFPPIVLAGDPNGTLDTEDGTNDRWHIPSQILLGVTAQESNMWQATRYAVPGTTANSLIGNYYGVDYNPSGTQADPWRIDWSKADCGYGITQATDGMRLPGHDQPTKSVLQQEAIALDYTANIAAGAQILSEKWNQTYNAGMKVNDGHPKWIENWFFALWAYNSGFYPQAEADSAGHWGVGWTNNPANPLWKANRLPFLDNTIGGDNYADAAHPQDWPYEEKVIGWAGHPITAMFGPGDMQAGYRPAWWNTTLDRAKAKPPLNAFCDASNSCDPSKISDADSNDPGKGACTLDSGDKATNPHWLHCWWNKPVTWKNCGSLAQCGNQVHRFNTSYPEQPDANSYPPRCSSGLPTNALIVDDVPNGVVPAGSDARSCGTVKSDGTFNLNYYIWSDGTYPGKMDTHQIGAAYGNHFWFTHTRQPDPTYGHRLYINGVWKLGRTIPGGQAKVYAHIPDHGAQTKIADYKITTVDGIVTKTISQADNQSNKWVDLGAYQFGDTRPEVSLSNFTSDGNGDKDIAWDAIAFVPGDYSGIPADLTFGDPDPFAPEPVKVETPDSVNDSFFQKAPLPLAGPTGGVAKSGAPMQSADSLFVRPAVVGATSGAGDTASCSVTQNSITYTRTQSCVLDDFTIILRDTNNTQLGSATFIYRMEMDTDPNTDIVTQTASVRLKSMDAAVTTATFNVDFLCRGYCQVDTSPWSGSTTWTRGDTHEATVTSRLKWTPAAGAESDVLVPHWRFNGLVNGGPWTPAEVEKSELDIRCDIEVKATPGCVFSRYKPTYSINAKKFPAVSAHIWLMQNKLPGGYGLRGKEPLTFLSNDVYVPNPPTSTKTLVDHNRDTICPDKSVWERSPLATMSPELGANDVPSCDEFPFAASWESAAIPKSWGGKNLGSVTTGEGCVNTIAQRDASGVWRLVPDSRSHLPTWTEPCGRASMSNNQNTQSMSLFPTFRRDNRVLEGDAYWVDAPKP